MKSKLRISMLCGQPVAMLCAAVLCGCALGPDFVRPALSDSQRYTPELQNAATVAADGLSQRFETGNALLADWWRLFKSEPLDETVRRALANNPTLQASEARLRQSQEELLAGDGVFYPQVGAGFGGERARSAPIQQGSAAPANIFSLVTASANVSYVLDVFGGERRTVEGLSAQVQVLRYTASAAYLTLSANVVNTCIARAAYAAQIHVTEELIALEIEQLRSAEVQVRTGTLPYANVLSQRSLIATNQALLSTLRQKVSQAEHLLMLLQGVTPDNVPPPEIDLTSLTLPLDLPLSLPSELVRQRPDILAAEAQLHVANANVGVATAAQYPSFTLNAEYGAAGSSLRNLASPVGSFWSVGPSLLAPLFRGGSLHAQRQAAVDAYNVQQANYRQTVLAAFAQVADALKALEHDAQALQAQVDARRDAGEALQLLKANYRAGLVAYGDVLTADVQYHTAVIAYLQALAQRHQDTVALFVALGGGWWNAQDPANGGRAP